MLIKVFFTLINFVYTYKARKKIESREAVLIKVFDIIEIIEKKNVIKLYICFLCYSLANLFLSFLLSYYQIFDTVVPLIPLRNIFIYL